MTLGMLLVYLQNKLKVWLNVSAWSDNICEIFILSVIPLEDLPEFQVGFGFGVADKDKAKKPAYLKVL